MTKYAKFIDENTIEEAPAVKDGNFFNYNSEANEPMLLADGYLPVVLSDETVTAPRVKMKYRLEDDRIVAYWAEIPFSLEELKQRKLEEIKSSFKSAKEYGTAEYNGMSFSIDDTAQQNLTSMMVFAQTFETSVKYLEKNGTPHLFTLDEFKQVAAVISSAIQELTFKFYDLETQINAAGTEADLEEIQWQ